MPWDIKKVEGEYCIFKTGDDKKVACHKTRGEAVDQMRALYASEADKSAYASFAKEDLEEAVNHLKMALQSVPEDDALHTHLLEALAALGEQVQDEEESEFGNGSDSFTFADNMKEYAWEGPIVFENVYTGDNRIFETNSINWQVETLPWAFRWQKASGQGHAGSVPVGRVDRIERKEDGSIYGYGVVIPDLSEEASQYLKMLQTGVGGGVSVDGDSAQFEIQEQESGQPRVKFSSMRLRALSGVDIPAFNGARIHLVGSEPEKVEVQELETEEVEALETDTEAQEEFCDDKMHEDKEIDVRVALAKKKEKRKKKGGMLYGWNIDEALTAAAIPVLPSTDAFTDPSFDGPTALTVTPDGRVFGHLALFNSCHIGFPGTCVKPPKGSKYQYFHTGQIETAEGDLVEVGKLTFKTGHAEMAASPRIAAEHYDNTGAVAADVRAGEDKFGIWVVGALRPRLTDEDIREFRAAPLSGDWRRIAGKLELVGALSVNVPGFPVPRIKALVASGETETLFTFIEDDNEEFFSEYELGLRVDKKIELASKLSNFLGEELDLAAPEGRIEDDEIPSFTKKELQERADNYTKNQLFADIKLVRDLLDDPEEKMPKRVREGLEELYQAVIKVDDGGKRFSYDGYDLDIIDNSGLEIEEWVAELELSGLDVVEFYNQCHDEDGLFCEGQDGPGRVRDKASGRHYVPGARPGDPAHSPDPQHATREHNRTPGGTPRTGTTPPGPPGPPGGGGGGVNPRTYENFRITRKRAAGWAGAATLALAALASPASGILTGIATAAGVGILANPLTLGLIFTTGVAYAGRNAAAARRHRADFNRQVDRKLRIDRAEQQNARNIARARNT